MEDFRGGRVIAGVTSTPLDQPRRGVRVKVGAKGYNHDTGLEDSGIGVELFGDGIDRSIEIGVRPNIT